MGSEAKVFKAPYQPMQILILVSGFQYNNHERFTSLKEGPGHLLCPKKKGHWEFDSRGPNSFIESENKRAAGPLRDTHGFDALS